MRITPHPSHTIGIVDGETRCVICWADPTWAISEQECDIAATTPAERASLLSGRPQVRGPAMPCAAIVLATSLRDEGMPWASVAERVGGYSVRAIQQAVLRYEKRGRQPRQLGRLRKERAVPWRRVTDADMDAARSRQVKGEAVTDIAADMGVSYEALLQRLRRDLVSMKGAA